jgi:hypothetical protein
MKFLPGLPGLVAESQQKARRFLICAVFAFASAVASVVGLCFLTYALFDAWRLQYGAVSAATGLGAIYLVVAGILYLCYRRAALKPLAALGPGARTASEADAIKAAAQSGDPPQVAALAMGVELAKQLTPLQLAMLAVISGFVAGRKL